MTDINPKNARRWVNSYFDNPNRTHIGFGALGAVTMWIIGALDIGFGKPPMWVYIATGAGTAGVTYAVDVCVSSVYKMLTRS